MAKLTVDLDVRNQEQPAWSGRYRDFILRVLDDLHIESGEISILLCEDTFMAALNEKYRNNAETTDVLSFSQNEGYDGGAEKPPIFGDIVISLETVRRQADEYGLSWDDEVKRVSVHAILHLLGMDHENDEIEGEAMLKRQEEMLKDYSEVRLL